MTSSVVQTKRDSVSERFPPFDDSVSLRLTPTPSGNYRCPVSTPANFVQCAGKIRRTKPLHDLFRSTQSQAASNGRVKAQRSRLTALSRASKHQKCGPRTGRGIDYYFVDPKENRREEEVTNSHWLRALCAQPVDEILGKYRRRTDLHSTQLTMVRSCSTPGERSLVNAWESSLRSGMDRGGLPRKQTVRSAVTGKHQKANSPDRRTTKSEPALSRVQQNVESVERYGLSPRIPVNGGQRLQGKRREGFNRDKLVDDKGRLIAFSEEPPHMVKGFLLDEASGDEDDRREKPSPPRYVSFTTQLFRQSDAKGNARLYSKITRGPEHLPYISNSKRVISMVHNTQVYSRKFEQDNSLKDNTATLDSPQEGSNVVPEGPQEVDNSALVSLTEGRPPQDTNAVLKSPMRDRKSVTPDDAATSGTIPHPPPGSEINTGTKDTPSLAADSCSEP